MPAQRIETPDGISWHIETFSPSTSTGTAKEYIILIPSGEGDCHNLTAVAELLSSRHQYHILTFDMPGFSRTTAPSSAVTGVTLKLLVNQIIGLLDKLDIRRASVFGCSSGGCATLALCSLFPSRVKCGIVHEVPFFVEVPPPLLAMKKLSDQEIVAACQASYANGFIEKDVNDGLKKWEALGTEYHERLAKNYVTWVKYYVKNIELVANVKECMLRRPVFWTVGGLNRGADKGEGVWKKNFEVASEVGLKVNVERLQCLHFPSVTVTEELAEWIAECVAKVKYECSRKGNL